jgi:hypothetical protein
MKKAAARPVGTSTSFVVTASHDAVLLAVFRYQLLTSVQLLKVCGYSPNSLERIQRLTKQLVDNEYVLSLPIPVTRGKSPLVYALARKGLNYLKDADFDVRVYFRPSKEQEKSYLFLQHILALNDVLIAASNLHKGASGYSLFSFTHERVLKQTPYKITISRNDKQESVTVIPDAFLLFAAQKKKGKAKNR